MSTRHWTTALCAAIVLFGSGAHGDGASPAERAAEIYKRANALYDAGKLEAAEKLYREAWSISKSYDVASNLGAVMFDRGDYREAAEYLSYALANFPAGGKAAERQGIEKALSQAKARVATLRISVNVTRARVMIDGKPIGEAPVAPEVFVEVGKRTVEAQADGYVSKSAAIEAKAGQATEVKIELTAVMAPPTATGSATAAPTSSASAPATPKNMVPAYVTGGGALVSLILGGVFVGNAEGRRADARKLFEAQDGKCAVGTTSPTGTCAKIAALSSDINIFGNTGIALLSVGTAAAVVTAAYVFWPTGKTSERTAKVAPITLPGGGGMVVFGDF